MNPAYSFLSKEGVPVHTVVSSDEDGRLIAKYGDRKVMLMGGSVTEYAKLLFERIREAEKSDYNLIIAEGVPMGGMGTTLLSRLIKLSGGKVI